MLAYERHGAGEPLVLVHGITHRRQVWYPVLDRLTEHFEVVLVDLPGHGDSAPFVLDGLSVKDALRRDFEAFLREQQLDRPHVVGNSLGGLVALHAGANGRARSVTCLSPAGFWRDEREFRSTRRFFNSLLAITERLGPRTENLILRTPPLRTAVLGTLVAHPGRVPIDHLRGDVRGFMTARPALRTVLEAAEPFTEDIPREVPVTIAWAARDLVLPISQSATARERLPYAEHVVMPGVGHVPMFDDPGLVAEVILTGAGRSTAPAATVTHLTPRRTARGPASVARSRTG